MNEVPSGARQAETPCMEAFIAHLHSTEAKLVVEINNNQMKNHIQYSVTTKLVSKPGNFQLNHVREHRTTSHARAKRIVFRMGGGWSSITFV